MRLHIFAAILFRFIEEVTLKCSQFLNLTSCRLSWLAQTHPCRQFRHFKTFFEMTCDVSKLAVSSSWVDPRRICWNEQLLNLFARCVEEKDKREKFCLQNQMETETICFRFARRFEFLGRWANMSHALCWAQALLKSSPKTWDATGLRSCWASFDRNSKMERLAFRINKSGQSWVHDSKENAEVLKRQFWKNSGTSVTSQGRMKMFTGVKFNIHVQPEITKFLDFH